MHTTPIRRSLMAGIALLLVGVSFLALMVPGGGPGASEGLPSVEPSFEILGGKFARNEKRGPVFGRSVEGRELIARRIGERAAKRRAIVVGQVHGDEPEGREIVRQLRRRYRELDGVRVWTVLTINPDGDAAETRKNARGVDLNRNFPEDWSDAEPPSSGYYGGPKPLSEPESRAFARLARRVRPDVTVHYHQPWDRVLRPCSGPAPLHRTYARIAGMKTSCRGAGLPGRITGWQNDRLPGTAFVVELGEGELSRGERDRHVRALAAVLRG